MINVYFFTIFLANPLVCDIVLFKIFVIFFDEVAQFIVRKGFLYYVRTNISFHMLEGKGNFFADSVGSFLKSLTSLETLTTTNFRLFLKLK